LSLATCLLFFVSEAKRSLKAKRIGWFGSKIGAQRTIPVRARAKTIETPARGSLSPICLARSPKSLKPPPEISVTSDSPPFAESDHRNIQR